MDTAEMAPRLPGTSARGFALGMATTLGVLVPLFAVLTIPEVASTGEGGGHLPWPVMQWSVTSPIGAIVLMAIGTLITAPQVALLQPRTLYGYYLAQAIDVTGMPVERWSLRARTEARQIWIERWLGHGGWEQRRSIVLLFMAVLAAAGVVATFIASNKFSFSAIDSVRCGLHDGIYGCPPLYEVLGLAFVSMEATAGLFFLVQYRWLRRAEAICGISLRYPTLLLTAPLYYLRRSGVTSEAAAEALADFVPGGGAPLAQVILVTVLTITPLVLLMSGSLFLDAWLRLQWIPG
jgi:hypothetical protein